MPSTIPFHPTPSASCADSPDTNITEAEVIEIFKTGHQAFSMQYCLSFPPVRLEYTALAQKCAIYHGLANNAWMASDEACKSGI